MRILVNGLPYFSKKIVDDLNELDDENKYVFIDTYTSFWEQIKFLCYHPLKVILLGKEISLPFKPITVISISLFCSARCFISPQP